MAIKGLTDRQEARFPRIGFLRKGGKKRQRNGKEIMGVDLDHFRFDSEDEGAVADFTEAYGNEPKQVNVFFPWPTAEQNFQAWKEAYTAGALQHRCDGETCVLWLDGDGEYRTDPRPSVIIPELGRFAFVTALTHSIHDIMELQSNLEAYELLGGQLRGVPFVLRRVERKISTPGSNGKRVRRAKWLMHLETKPEWSKMKLAGLEMDALPAHVRAALPAPVEAQLVVNEWQAEQSAERIAAMSPDETAAMLERNVNRMRGPEWTAFDEAADGQYRIEVLDADGYDADAANGMTELEQFATTYSDGTPVHPEPTTNDDALPFHDQGTAVKWAIRFEYYQKDGKPDPAHAVGSINKICKELNCNDREVECWGNAFYRHVMSHDLDAQAAAEA